jgi:hypothetical protein
MRVTGQMRQGPRGEVGLDAGGAAGFRASRGPHRGFRRPLPARNAIYLARAPRRGDRGPPTGSS